MTSDRILASLIEGSAIPVKRHGLSGSIGSAGGNGGYEYSGTHGYIWTNNAGKQIDVFEHGTTTNATNIADYAVVTNQAPNAQNDTVIVMLGGTPTGMDDIQEYTIGSASNATSVADLVKASGRTRSKAMDGTYGYILGGHQNNVTFDDIQQFEFETTTDSTNLSLLSRDTCNQGGGINGNDKSIAYSIAGFSGSRNFGTISSYEMGTGTTATAIATERTSRDICSMQNTTYIFTGGGSDGQGVTKFEIGTTTNSAELGTMSTNTASYGTSQSTTHGYLYGGNQSTAVSLSIYEYEFDTSATITDVADLSVASSGTNASGSGTP